METRRRHRQLGSFGPAPSFPDRPSLPPRVPGPVPWMCTDPISEVPTVRSSRAPRGYGACAWRLGEPFLQPPPQEASRRPALRPETQPAASRPSRVLLVDDNHHHRIPIRRALRDHGHSVLYAADGASGEAIARTSQLEIDALVACADMKRMSGFELGRRLRRMHPDVRVLLMSRHSAGPEVAHRAYEPGFAVIEEPFTPERLCRELKGLLASPHNDSCAELRLVGQDRLLPREDEVLTMAPRTRTDTQGEPDGTNPTSKPRR